MEDHIIKGDEMTEKEIDDFAKWSNAKNPMLEDVPLEDVPDDYKPKKRKGLPEPPKFDNREGETLLDKMEKETKRANLENERILDAIRSLMTLVRNDAPLLSAERINRGLKDMLKSLSEII